MRYIAELFNNGRLNKDKRISGERFEKFLNNLQQLLNIHTYLMSKCQASHSEMDLLFCAMNYASEHNGEYITVASAARQLNVSAPSISRTLKSLSERGLITRFYDKNDRRSVRIAVTNSGEQLLLDFLGFAFDTLCSATSVFSDKELADMIDLHSRIVESITNTLSNNSEGRT